MNEKVVAGSGNFSIFWMEKLEVVETFIKHSQCLLWAYFHLFSKVGQSSSSSTSLSSIPRPYLFETSPAQSEEAAEVDFDLRWGRALEQILDYVDASNLGGIRGGWKFGGFE